MIVQELFSIFGFKTDETTLKNVEASLDSMLKKAESFGNRMTLYITAPLVAFAGLGVKNAAENIEEMEKFNNVFGESAETVGKWSDEVANKFRLTNTEVKAALSNIQSFFLGIGAERGTASELSKEVYQLAADFGAFTKQGAEQAQQAIQMGLTGMGRGLKQYGIIIDDTRMKETAARMGLHKTVETMTEVEKSMVRLAMMRESMGDMGVLGAADKASKRLGASLRAVKNGFLEFAESIGMMIAPAVEKISSKLWDFFKFLSEDLSPAIKWMLVIIGGLVAIAGPVIVAFTTMAGAGLMFKTMLDKIAFAASRAGVAVGVLLTEAVLIAAGVAAAAGIIILAIDDIYTYLNGGESVIGKFIAPWSKIGPAFKETFLPLWILFKEALSDALSIVKNVVGLITNLLTDNTGAASKNIEKILEKVVSLFGNLAALIVPLVLHIIGGVAKAAVIGMYLLMEKLSTLFWDSLYAIFSGVVDYVGKIFSDAWESIKKTPFGKILSKGAELAISGVEAVSGLLGSDTGAGVARAALSGPNFGEGVVGVRGSGANRNVNTITNELSVSIKPDITVPAGTTSQQVAFLQDSADLIFQRGIDSMTRQITAQLAGR